MKNLIIAILAILIFSACEDANPAKTENSYFENAQLNAEQPFISSGSSIVFQRFFEAEEEENIADDEYSEYIFMEVPSGQTSFSYQNDELSDIKIDFRYSCFCIPVDSIQILSGIVSGTKQGERWKIDADIRFSLYHQYDQDSSMLGETLNRQFSGLFDRKAL